MPPVTSRGEEVMVKRIAFLAVVAAAVCAVCLTAVQAAPVNATGKWNCQLTNGSNLMTGVVTFNQVGETVIGHAGNTTINGTMVSDTKMNAKWNGPKGAGWMTIYFGASGSSLQGDWGWNGRKANGSFVGKRIMSM
ncbi:MAG: hypothetical protein JO343_02125 [Candidatus Eremiobacteraeota bacterium]|nr:hypothetical protein [Candidatus Eremiobacteraeota bacterium]